MKSHFPGTYQEALWILEDSNPVIIAGGTDLMVKKRSWAGLEPVFPRDVMFVSQLNELDYVIKTDGKTRIGATATLESLLGNTDVPELLKKAVRLMASPGIRHTATLAGNVGNASPAGDSLPALYVLNARIILGSIGGERDIAIEDFITGPGKTAMLPGEMIKETIIENPGFDVLMYEKVGGRKSDAISKVSFAGSVTTVFDMVSEIRMAFGAVAPVVVRVRELESRLRDTPLKELVRMSDLIEEQYDPYIKPITDQRSNAAYKRRCALNLLRKFLKESSERYR